MFSVATTWPILENIQEYIEINSFPMEVLANQVHYTEDIKFYRPMRPGDNLLIKGKIAAILPHRAGTYLVIRFDSIDAGNKPVFTEHTGALLRGTTCSDEGKGEKYLPSHPSYSDNTETKWESAVQIDPLRPYIYDGCSNIFFPIHTSIKFAHQVGLPGIILQGTATLAIALREIINKEAKGDPTRLRSVSCRFTGMVIPGTDIKIHLIGKQKDGYATQLFFNVLNSYGKRAISNGYVSLEGTQ